MKKLTVKRINIYDLEDEYKPSSGLFNEDDIFIDRIKKIIYNELSETERRIILCYAEIGNIRDLASLFKVSTTTMWHQVNNVKKKIKDILNEYIY